MVGAVTEQGIPTGRRTVTEVKNISERTHSDAYGDGTGLRTAGLEDADLADYEIQVLATLDKYDDGKPRWYAHADYFGPYTVDLARAEKMVKALRKIERGLGKERDNTGWYAATPGHALARHARLLGVDTVLIAERGNGWNHVSTTYAALALDAAVEHVNDLYRQWVSSVAPQHLATIAS
jgi:hypothetical protein